MGEMYSKISLCGHLYSFKMKIISLVTHSHVISTLWEFLSAAEH